MANEEKDSVRKAPKKLVIIDGNDPAEEQPVGKDETPNKGQKNTDSEPGDTPPVDTQQEDSTSVNEEQSTVDATEADLTESVPKEITIGDAIDAADVLETTESEDVGSTDKQEIAESDSEAVDASHVEEPESPVAQEAEELFTDDKIAKAVDDIVTKESDELLAREDEEQRTFASPKKDERNKLKRICSNWWKNPATKWGTCVGLLLVVLLVAVLPASRYGLLNAFGIRAGASVAVVSSDSQQPLKNVEISIGGQTEKTDEKGMVSFSNLKLGKSTIKIQKRGYGAQEISKTLGWGSNPLGQIALAVTGSQFTFVVTDYLSDKAVLSAEAVSGDYNAQADKDGKIILPLGEEDEGEVEVFIKAADYREEKITIKQNDSTEKKVKLVAERKHVFVSKRTGKLDIYKIDADATNETLLLQATGTERDDLALLPHPTKDFVAVVSTREGRRNKDGYLLSTLFVINIKTSELTKITLSERIQLIDWSGDRIVYIAVTEGASAANAARSKLLSFEIGQPGPKEIASANYFNDAVVFKGSIYYAPSSYAVAAGAVKFFRVNPDGSASSSLLDKEVWNIFRSDYDSLLLSFQQDWYELKTGSAVTKMTQPPANPKTRVYRDSPDKKRSLWVDSRDGKGVLLAYDSEAKTDNVLQSQSGLVQPNHWLNNTTYIYRISDGREVADYVKSTEGGEAKKLRDVTNTDFSNYFNY